MESENAESDRYTLDNLSKEDLFFIQHSMVLAGCSLTGNMPDAVLALNLLLQCLQKGFDAEGLQKRILTLVGVDISEIDESKTGVTFLQDKSKDKAFDFETTKFHNKKNVQ